MLPNFEISPAETYLFRQVLSVRCGGIPSQAARITSLARDDDERFCGLRAIERKMAEVRAREEPSLWGCASVGALGFEIAGPDLPVAAAGLGAGIPGYRTASRRVDTVRSPPFGRAGYAAQAHTEHAL
ncbi:hypothetical protein Jann_2491 [Jannaschia sp. CCS1]|nr:hypothetical protein Jann_2491 [Jannaschia sp. CCS1]